MLIIKGLAILGIALGAVASAAAQSAPPQERIPKAEIAVDYSYMRANATPGQCGCFSLNGGSATVSLHVYRNFSVVGDITGEHAGTTSIAGQSLSLLSYTGGPRFSYPLRRSQRTPIIPYIQGLVGGVHGFDAPFPNSSGTLSSSGNALAVLVGGGVDVVVSRRFAIRAVQVDYGLDHLPNNADNSQNLLRVSTGVVFHIR
jgi:peptidoglycan-associated lipoprotein